MPTERFQFTGEGGHQLAAALDLPEREPIAYALFAHCFTCGKDVLAARRIAFALAAKGIAVLRFDFTGLGSSEGEFANSPSLEPRPVKSNRSTAMPFAASANAMRRAASTSLPQVKQCANNA